MRAETLRRTGQILREEIREDVGNPAERRKTAKLTAATLACTTPFLLFVSRAAGADIKTFGFAAAGTAIGTVTLVGVGAYSQARREIRDNRRSRS